MEVTKRVITYKELLENTYHVENDKYDIAAYLTESRRQAFLHNPNLKDYDKPVQNLYQVDGVVVGGSMGYETLFKNDSEMYPAQGGSALETHKDYRHLGIGVDAMLNSLQNRDYDYIIYGGISPMALPIYRKLRYVVFEFPRMMLIQNSRSLVEARIGNGAIGKMSTCLLNFPLKLLKIINCYRSKLLQKKFEVRKETIVPRWVDRLILEDGHKYMEVHDSRWLQWNLDYNFKRMPQDRQAFYTVWKDGEPIGFFMTKERFRELAGGILKNVLIGSIVEWGTALPDILTEEKLNKMAISTFSSCVDIIEFATTDLIVVKTMKKWGFISHGFAHIVFKDKTKKLKDTSDINLWRIRYGYADVILT